MIPFLLRLDSAHQWQEPEPNVSMRLCMPWFTVFLLPVAYCIIKMIMQPVKLVSVCALMLPVLVVGDTKGGRGLSS